VLDTHMIQTRGFRNRHEGFEVRLRLPYYRGLWTGLIVGASVEVDGEQHAPEDIAWTIGDRTWSLEALRSDESARWSLDQPATLSVPRSEGLALGFHDVAVELRLNMSYIPEELQPTVWSEERRLVISQ
jgi:hypothetical protein